MGRNLKYQLKHAIDQHFKEGMDKHAIKRAGERDGVKIFSYADRKNLIDVASNFANYMRDNHPEVKQVKDVTSEHVQSFLNSKAKECSSNTLYQYQSKFNKLEKVINATYKSAHSSFSKGLTIPPGKEKQRSIEMNRGHYNKLLSNISHSRSQAVPAIQLAGRFGLRVSETVNLKGKDIQLDKGVLHIHESKGGRSRDIPVTKEADRAFLVGLKSQYGDNQRVVPLKEDSVNRFLQRELGKMGLTQYRAHGTGIHAIRKMYAQGRYDEYRQQGLSIKESLDRTSELLGHGADRDELMRQYVLDIH